VLAFSVSATTLLGFSNPAALAFSGGDSIPGSNTTTTARGAVVIPAGGTTVTPTISEGVPASAAATPIPGTRAAPTMIPGGVPKKISEGVLASASPISEGGNKGIPDGVLASASAAPGNTAVVSLASPHLWSPALPTLYSLRVTAGKDTVVCYLGFRSFAVGLPGGIPTPSTLSSPSSEGGAGGWTGGGFAAGLPGGVPTPSTPSSSSGGGAGGLTGGTGLPGGIPSTEKNEELPGGIPSTDNTGLPGGIPSTKKNEELLVARPLLNGKPTFLAGWLDQSYWPDGIYTAPTDEALRFDILAASRCAH